MRSSSTKYAILGSLCALVMVLAVAYAAFQSNLKIKGTSNITSEWDIRITNIAETNKGGGATTTVKEGVTNPNWDGLTANIEADLQSPGDFIEYEITIENKGTIDAVLKDIKLNEESHEAIKFSVTGVNKYDKLYKGERVQLILKIEYNSDFSGSLDVGSANLQISLDYVQATVAGVDAIKKELYVSSNGNDKTGYGTVEKPYATISKAYNEAADTATIHIMDDLALSESVKFDQNKNIALTSYDKTSTISRTSGIPNSNISVTSGNLQVENLNFHGKSLVSTSPMIEIKGTTATFGSGVTMQYCYCDKTEGCALAIYNKGKVTIDGAIFTHNYSSNQSTGYQSGGAIFCYGTGSSLIMNSGTISYNHSNQGGGVSIGEGATATFNGGSIIQNNANIMSGGIFMNNSTVYLTNTKIDSNVSNGTAGGIGIQFNANLYIKEGTVISNNNSAGIGGGILADHSSNIIMFAYAVITGNRGAIGGGIAVYNSSTATLHAGDVTNNVVTSTGGGLFCATGTTCNYLANISGNSPNNVIRN